jgi:hypothetical protein
MLAKIKRERKAGKVLEKGGGDEIIFCESEEKTLSQRALRFSLLRPSAILGPYRTVPYRTVPYRSVPFCSVLFIELSLTLSTAINTITLATQVNPSSYLYLSPSG